MGNPACPVFIVGPPRSGTTLIRLMLNRHSELAIPDETGIFSWLYYYGSGMPRFFRGPASREKNLVSSLGYDVTRKFDALSESSIRKSPRKIMENLFTSYAKKQNKLYWGEKTPTHLIYVKQMKKMFPDCTIICMTRDPRAVIASYLRYRNSKDHKDGDFWIFHSVEDAVKEYLRYAKMQFNYKKYINIIKYEDLICNTQHTLEQACLLLGLSFEDNMLQYSKTAENNLNASLRNGHIPEWKREVFKPPSLSLLNRWKNELSNKDVRYINSKVGKYLDFFEYSVDYDNNEVI